MVKKKVKSKSSSKKRVAKGTSISSTNKKRNLAWKNLIFFGLLFTVSFVVYYYLNNGLLQNFFGILSLIMGFIALSFLIVYLILLFMNWFKK